MDLIRTVKHLIRDPKDALHYITGKTRQYMYDTPVLRWMLREHIVATYKERKLKASKCLLQGECLCCGCELPSLLFANKECSADKIPGCNQQGLSKCFGPMPTRKEWLKTKNVENGNK